MARRVVAGVAAVAVLAILGLLLAASPTLAQETGSFSADPTSGPIGTEITIDGSCPDDAAGDAIALYRVADDALVDAELQLGNGQPDPTAWQTTLVVEPRLETAAGPDAEPTSDGDYELRLFCEIGSSFRNPSFVGQEPTSRDDATAILPFTVGEPDRTADDEGAADEGAEPPPDEQAATSTDDDDPVPTLTRLIPSSDEVDWSAERVATNVLLSLALVALLPFPAGLFNSTFEANHDEIRSWLPSRRSPAAPRSLLAGFVALVAVSALLQAFLDPDLAFDAAGGVLLVGLALSIAATTALAVLPAATSGGRGGTGTGAEVKLFPLALLIAATCVLVSRVAGFEPGYLYGLVAGIGFATAATREISGRMALRTTVFLLLMSGAAFVLRIPVADAASDGDVAVPLALLDTVLAAVFAAGIGADVITLLPVRFLPGEDLFKWRRGAWAVITAVAAFGFLQTLSSTVGSREPGDSIRLAVILFVAFGAASIAFWSYFRVRTGRQPD